jgi:hypothetical protein
MTLKKIKKPKQKTISLIEMELAISRLFGIRQHIIIPNISWGFLSHEADLVVITKAGCLKEIEIKRSFSDFKADFKKGHNHNDRQNRITEFYYAIPIELLEKCLPLVPEDAGIITCHDGTSQPYARFNRRAKRIRNSKTLTADELIKITRLGCMRIMPLKQKILTLQHKLNETKIQ